MKKVLIATLLFFSAIAVNAQSNVTTDSAGNYIARSVTDTATAIQTGKTFTDAKGKVYPVMKSKKGKLFVIRTSKTGNKYKYYLKP